MDPDRQVETSAGDIPSVVTDHPAAARARSIEAAAVAGICYAVLALLATSRMTSYPSLDVTETELTAWFDDEGNQTLLVGALALASVAAIAFLWFVAVIRRRIGDREDKFFSTVFFGSGIVHIAVSLAASAALAAPAVAMTRLDGAVVTPAVASLAGGLADGLFLVVGPRIQAVFIFTASTVILRSKVLPSWLAFVGYVAGLVLFLSPFLYVPLGYVFPVWVFAVSVVLLIVRPSRLNRAARGESVTPDSATPG